MRPVSCSPSRRFLPLTAATLDTAHLPGPWYTPSQSTRGMGDKNDERMRAAFNLFDPDGDGKITQEGLQNILKTLGKATSDAEMRTLIGGNVEGLFTERQGKIDYDTFVSIYVSRGHSSLCRTRISARFRASLAVARCPSATLLASRLWRGRCAHTPSSTLTHPPVLSHPPAPCSPLPAEWRATQCAGADHRPAGGVPAARPRWERAHRVWPLATNLHQTRREPDRGGGVRPSTLRLEPTRVPVCAARARSCPAHRAIRAGCAALTRLVRHVRAQVRAMVHEALIGYDGRIFYDGLLKILITQ